MRIAGLRDYFWEKLKKIYSTAETNPEEVALGFNLGQLEYLPNILNVYFPDHLAEDLLIKLDMAGVAVSSGAACSARSSKPSHVLKALGLGMERIMRSIRFSFGKPTKLEEIKGVLTTLGSVL